MSLLGPYRPMPKAAGSTIVVNPELEGNEPQLTGLEVDGEKYAAPHLYWHSISIAGYATDSSYIGGIVVVLSTSETPFDNSTFKELLRSNYTAKFIFVAGHVVVNTTGSPSKPLAYIKADGQLESSLFSVYYYDDNYNEPQRLYAPANASFVGDDAVNQIF